MMHNGHNHMYKGAADDQEALIDFTITNFHDSENKKRVPKIPSLWDEIRDFFNYEVHHKYGIFSFLLMKNEEG